MPSIILALPTIVPNSAVAESDVLFMVKKCPLISSTAELLDKDNNLVMPTPFPRETLPVPLNVNVPTNVSAAEVALKFNVLSELLFITNVEAEEPTNVPAPVIAPLIVND